MTILPFIAATSMLSLVGHIRHPTVFKMLLLYNNRNNSKMAMYASDYK